MPNRNALDDAAFAALLDIERRGSSHEHIGLLYGSDPVQRTPTATRNRAGKVKGRFAIPAGSLRGIFHNHPNTGARKLDLNRFSEDDIEQAQKLGVPSYIMGGNEFRRYTPGVSSSDRGEPVLAQLPIEEIRAYLMRRILGREPDDMRGLMR